jgi:hypothetical protein
MLQKMMEHALSMGLIIGLLGLSLLFVEPDGAAEVAPQDPLAAALSGMDFIDINSDFHQVLAEDMANLFFPERRRGNGTIVTSWFQARQDAFFEGLQKVHLKEKLNEDKVRQLLGMTAKFIITYVLVLLLTYYGVQTMGAWRFIKKKQSDYGHGPSSAGPAQRVLKGLAHGGRIGLSLVMFCPAYVIAYSLRTEFSTDSLLFVLILGVVSNGLLITYANKFYQFLIVESRKGFVETAQAKNLNNHWAINQAGGIPLGSILKPVKKFEGHVFGHIFANAAHQYLATVKEQAAFLVTGLIIIEMALNIQGRLSYEMLRQLLHKNIDIVIAAAACIFLTVKITEVVADWLIYFNGKRYENI